MCIAHRIKAFFGLPELAYEILLPGKILFIERLMPEWYISVWKLEPRRLCLGGYDVWENVLSFLLGISLAECSIYLYAA